MRSSRQTFDQMYSDIQTKMRIEGEIKLAYTTAILVCMLSDV